MSDPREVELKLDVGVAEAATVERRSLEAFGDGKTEQLSAVYFDTPKRTLQKHGAAVRVRTNGATHIQTVKVGPGSGIGLFDRSEWETTVDGMQLNRKALAATPVGDILAAKRGKLNPVFKTIVKRRSWTVEAGRSTVEVALDQGRVVAGDKTQTFAELELELKSGKPSDLFALACRLGTAQPLKLGVLTKSERGYALASSGTPAAFKAEPVAIKPEMTAAEAFRAIAHACLRQFRLNETILLEHRSVESLHEARVAMRRLRSALSLFNDLIADETVERLKEELRAASRALGDARNLDVYLEHAVLPELERDETEPGVFAFFDHVQTLREKAYDDVVAQLNEGSFTRLMLDMLAWIEAGPWLLSDEPGKVALRKAPVAQAAAEILEARSRKLRKKGKKLEELDPPARHRVRIEAKKLRYAAEFFAELNLTSASRRRYDVFLKVLKRFQEHLGDLNDLHTGHELATALARDAEAIGIARAQMLFAAGHLAGEQDERVGPLLRAAVEAFDEFAGAKRFWRRWQA